MGIGAHVHLEQLQRLIDREVLPVRLMGLADAAMAALDERAPGGMKVGVLLAGASVSHEAMLAALAATGRQVVLPRAEQQTMLDQCIDSRGAVEVGACLPEQLLLVAQELADAGADCLLMAIPRPASDWLEARLRRSDGKPLAIVDLFSALAHDIIRRASP